MRGLWLLLPLFSCTPDDGVDPIWDEPELWGAGPAQLPPPVYGGITLDAPASSFTSTDNTFVLTGAFPGEPVYLFRSRNGAGAGPCYPGFGGACLEILAPARVTAAVAADAAGVATFVLNPGAIADGSTYSLQAAIIHGYRGSDPVFSNVVDVTFQDFVIDGTSCASILASNPGAVDGVYTIDPDGPGNVLPFSVYCDMTHDGGGWTLVLVRDEGQPTSHASSTLTPTDVGMAISNDRWAALNAISTESLATSPTFATTHIADMAVMRAANCKPLAADLTDNLIAHQENSGCNSVGLDYSLWFGSPANPTDNAVCFNRSSPAFFSPPLSAGFRPDPGLMFVR